MSHRWEMERGESSWLEALAVFDREQGWVVDGQLSGAEWLMWRTKMGRATAYEKLRIAHELAVRPVVAEAFAAGRVSYSAVRVITRVDGPDGEVDAALVDLAEAGSVADVERAVRHYQRYADQDRPLGDPAACRDVRFVRHGDGTGRLEVSLTEVELEELAVIVQAFVDLRAEAPAQSPWGDSPGVAGPDVAGPGGAGPGVAGVGGVVGVSPGGDSEAVVPVADWSQRRADAVMEMARSALAHAGDGHAMGADRYMLHVVVRDGDVELLDGTPLDAAEGAAVACDAAVVLHLDEPLALGRKARVWNTAQRRAIMVRDGGCCRFPGCSHRIVDIHHRLSWDDGGPTDVGNGLLVCAGHHRLLHQGFQAVGDTGGPVLFSRPDGTPLGHTGPLLMSSRPTTPERPDREPADF